MIMTMQSKSKPAKFEREITETVNGRMGPKVNPRTAELMSSLVRHLHDFVRDVEPTEQEWFALVDFLTRTGQMCSDKRQEFVLLSDTLGISMLVDAINHRGNNLPGGSRHHFQPTESTVFGPFHRAGVSELQLGASIQGKHGGEPTVMRGRVLSDDGTSIPNAMLDVWETDEDGFYDSQKGDDLNLRGIFHSDAKGEFWFKCIKPVAYPIPDDGPVGEMLRALGRHPWRPAHIHTIVSAAGHAPVTTHLFVKGSKYLDSDAVFGVKDSLIVTFVPNRSKKDAAKYGMTTPFHTVTYDFVLKKI